MESFTDITLIEAIVMCLTRLQPLLRSESPIHKALFWVAISILQLDEIRLYASGLALLEQNLLTLDSHGVFDQDSIATTMLETRYVTTLMFKQLAIFHLCLLFREKLEWYFKQLDHSVGLSFKANFHFALVGHLIKGFRHVLPQTVTRTIRILSMMLSIVAKPSGRDKLEVTKENVAYLAALVSVSEDVRSRCRVKHTFTDIMPDSPTFDSFAVNNHLKKDNNRRPNSGLVSPDNEPGAAGGADKPAAMRQKSLDLALQPPSVQDGRATKTLSSPSTLEHSKESSDDRPSVPWRSQIVPLPKSPSPNVEDKAQAQGQAQPAQPVQQPPAGEAINNDQAETDSGCDNDSPPNEEELEGGAQGE